MKTKVSRLLYYLKLLSKKWILWSSFVIELLALAIGFFTNTVSIPPIVYWIIGLIGILWASYEVFEEVSTKIPEIQNAVLVPEVSINFIEGNEYSFDFYDHYKNKPNDILPWIEIQINLRIENVGDISVDILSIDIHCLGKNGKRELDSGQDMIGPLGFLNPSSITLNSKEVHLPVQLVPCQTFLCKLTIPIAPSSTMTPAQIASRLSKLLSNSTNYLILEVDVEIVDKSGEYYNFKNTHKIVARPLWDTYVVRWTETGEGELVRLAGGKYLPELISSTEKPLTRDEE